MQQENDQHGLNERFPWNLYANPLNSYICPVFTFAKYFSAFDASVDPNNKLFPGPLHYSQFDAILEGVLQKYEEKLIAMDCSRKNDIGTHSIHKGARKFLSRRPGGPSAISFWIWDVKF